MSPADLAHERRKADALLEYAVSLLAKGEDDTAHAVFAAAGRVLARLRGE